MDIKNILPDGWVLLKADLKKDGMIDIAVKPPTPIREVDGVGGLRRLPNGVWAGLEEPDTLISDIQTLEEFRTGKGNSHINPCLKIEKELERIERELGHEYLNDEEVRDRVRRKNELLAQYIKCKGGK